MKNTGIILTTLLLAWSCFPDERNNFMVDDSFGLSSQESIAEASVHTGKLVLGIVKSGKGQSAASIYIDTDVYDLGTMLASYNEENGTEYVAIPGNLYQMNKTEFSFSEKEVSQELVLSWNPEEVANYLGDSDKYVIPVIIKSPDKVVKVVGGRDAVLVHLNRSGVRISQAGINRVVEKKTVEPGKDGVQPPLQETVTMDVVIDNPIKGMAVTYPVKIDNGLIGTYNQTSETSYVAAPEGLVKIETPSITIPAGGRSATIKLTLDYSVLLENGKLPQFPSYVIPVSLDKEKLGASLNDQAFDLKGLSYGNTVTYVTFNWRETKLGLSIRREWGKYSAETDAWSSYIEGFSANSDRNVTLDGEFVYIAEANTTKNLWAISIKDPGSYRKLPVGTVKDQGTFYLCCPRVIANDNADVNGGKPVLAVSNMGMDGVDPSIYVYSNGIDADPSVIDLTTWASRRLGDTFTWWGTLQDGVLFFKDANSAQGTVTFWMKGKTTGTMYLVGRIAAPAVNGAGSYFPFPDNINAGFGSVRGGSSWYISTSKKLNELEGADNAPNIENLDPAWADCAFRYFELGGKRYIAAAKQDGSAAGRLIIIEGAPTDSWKGILSSGKIVYQAAIQNESENEGLDTTPSKMASGHSGMDLDVFQKGTDVYIAVVKQNVGLSLFHVNYDE